MLEFKYDICVVGGAGHVGLPLSLVFSDKGFKVCVFDINQRALSKIKTGEMPFLEKGAKELLKKNIGRNFFISSNPNSISESKFIVIVTGTPVDEHLNPRVTLMKEIFEGYLPYFRDGQIVILRSTVYPGTTEMIQEFFREKKIDVCLSFCPERIAQGRALEELKELPQIISGFNKEVIEKVSQLFKKITNEVIILEPLEAELAKLFTNSFRYIKFAIANQFYMITENQGVNFYRIYKAITRNYPRAKDFPKAGFVAGPCLFKDTMQLAAFTNNTFSLGHAAMLINEGLPNFIVRILKEKYKLKEKTVGILGMAFKANSDDKRESLSYKLKKILEIEASKIFCSDVYIKENNFIGPKKLIEKSDIIILAAPHQEYKSLVSLIKEDKILVDIWNFYGKQR